MNTVMGIINLQEDDSLVREMTARRPVATIPFAGRYRLIDFCLSNMVNSGIEHVGIMLPLKSRSVLDHVRSGKDWDLARRHDGLFYLPAPQVAYGTREGDLKSFYRHLDFIEHSSHRYVLLAGSQVVFNMNFEHMLRFHQNTGADISLIYNVQQEESPVQGTVLETAENGLVKDIAQQPVVYEDAKLSMGIYLMERKLFIDLVKHAFEHGGNDFLVDGIMRQHGKYTMYAMEHTGYTAHINSMASYYKASMDILKPEIREDIFHRDFSVYTKSKDESPVQYKKEAKAQNSLIANGCIIEGSVENSILFRGVKVGPGVHVKNSIIMQKCELQEDALIENVICDKNVVITQGKWLKGASNYPLVVEKNVVI